jgi:hypothetical protein
MGVDSEPLPPHFNAVSDEETLYRSVRAEFVRLEADNTVRFSANAFNDRERKPSVDRALLVDHQPQRSRKGPSDAVASLIAREVRAIEEVVERGPTGQVVQPYRIDVLPDPIQDDPQLPDNPAHARIQADRNINSSAFRHLKDVLARMAQQELPPHETG